MSTTTEPVCHETFRWNKAAAQLLLGHRIVRVAYMPHEQARRDGYQHRPLVIELDNGTTFHAVCDDEANDAGALLVERSHDGLHRLPRL